MNAQRLHIFSEQSPGKVKLRLNVSGKHFFWLMPISQRSLESRLRAMLAVVCSGVFGLDFLLVRDGEMAVYNATYMHCPGPTNVLSFPLEQLSAGNSINLGGLVLSADTLHRETRLYGQDSTEHCLRLLAHGLGHLLGFDHGMEMDICCAAMLRAASYSML